MVHKPKRTRLKNTQPKSNAEPALFHDLARLTTEQVNSRTKDIDEKNALGIVSVIHHEDKRIASAIGRVLPDIAAAVELVARAFQRGGRLFYIGAGTSGRLGILDASECPPTYGVPPEMVQGIIAGGNDAVFRSIEGAEDDETAGIAMLKSRGFSSRDILCGISASRRTPFVLGALSWAKSQKAKRIFITSNPDIDGVAEVIIRTIVGPEVIMGSTRMKAGTSHKMVLNMITTGAMIMIGKTYGNLMIDVQQTNRKLEERAKRILILATGCSYQEAEETLHHANGKVKVAVLMRLSDLSAEKAEAALKKHHGRIKAALGMTKKR